MTTPNWNDAPKWAKFVAQDPSGTWYWFSERPVARYCWVNTGYRGAIPVPGTYNNEDNPMWSKTLEERPRQESTEADHFKVIIQREETGQPIEYDHALNTFTKGPMFCVLFEKDGRRMVHKYPVASIFRVVETYEGSMR